MKVLSDEGQVTRPSMFVTEYDLPAWNRWAGVRAPWSSAITRTLSGLSIARLGRSEGCPTCTVPRDLTRREPDEPRAEEGQAERR